MPLATWHSGTRAWVGFAANSRKLADTPLLNHVGLRSLVAFSPAQSARRLEQHGAPDPHLRWKRSQAERGRERGWLVAAIAAVYAALLVRALPRLDDWAAAALGVGAIPFVLPLTSYYHAALTALALLWPRVPVAGVALCLLAAVTQALWQRLPFSDVPFVAMSAAEAVAILLITWRAGAR